MMLEDKLAFLKKELQIKVLVLQQLHNLADERIEYQIRDRLSFMRFLGLQLSSASPCPRCQAGKPSA